MGRFDANDRRTDDLVEAIERASHSINHTLREGFLLLALQIATATQSATPDNSKAIEAAAQQIKTFTDQLTKSLPKP